jgi:exoribonuclease II
MNILYEEEGGFKVGAILTDNDTSLQVEAPHGKRSKVKASAVLLRYREPSAAVLLEEAQRIAEETDPTFLWEVAGNEEFNFGDLAREYFGHDPLPAEAAGILMRLHSAPMHFYKKGKGRYKPAPEDALKAALASVERKQQQALQQAAYVEQLTRFDLPEAFLPQLPMLLYKPDKNTLECKALEQACHATALTPLRLLEKCGAIPSHHDFHYHAFLFEHFPKGTGFGEVNAAAEPEELPLSTATAFSIDDATTTEIDDAFSVSLMPNGNWRVGIHIAAPALGIQPGSQLDEIGASRLSTVYLPGDKITMLPDEAVERFTLSAEKVCPALSMYLEVESADYSVVSTETRVERVHIAANLRHCSLEKVFNESTLARGGEDYPFRQELETLWRFADKLELSRGKQDSSKAPQVDYSFVIDNDRVKIVPRLRGNPIDKVVSELMILVNSQWAKWLSEKGYAGIYRSQNNGKVRMTTSPGKHQGLGVDQYIWSSSPLRRYVDLINQRQLIALARGEPAPYPTNSEVLFTVLRDFELAHEAYNDFQRSMERYWCLRYLQQEGIEEIAVTVLKENIVRMDSMPLTARVPSLPELIPGTRVQVALVKIDLLELAVECQFKHRLDEEKAA